MRATNAAHHTSKLASATGSRVASAEANATPRAPRARALPPARASIGAEKSTPSTLDAPASAQAKARSPVPQPASSTASPGRTSARAAAVRHALWRPPVITVFVRS